jgi:glucose/arabinose dehydrogenase
MRRLELGSRKLRLLLVAGAAVVTAATAGAILSGTSHAASGSSPPAPLGVVSSPTCAPNTPAAVNCQQVLAQAESQAAAQWPPTSTAYLTQETAIAIARRAGTSAAQAAPAQALFTTYTSAAALVGASVNPNLASTTEVWVVTVDAPINLGRVSEPSVPLGANPSPSIGSSYTVILDATNGQPIALCSPCMAQVSP